MGVCGDDYVVLGFCYVERGEEGQGFEDGGKKSGGGGYAMN